MASTIETKINRIARNIADAYTAIRNRGGQVPAEAVSGNLASAIGTIPKGVTAQKKTGSFTTDSSGAATVNCGFQPDLVVITKNEKSEYGDRYVAAIPFYDYVGESICISLTSSNSSVFMYFFGSTRSATGFSVTVAKTNYSISTSIATYTNFSYIAYKLTE